mmetsp:Transcript_39184/g.97068  ORF Transcript_39184/g.97068 Transcript_39184/m.97068 type:complete len:83 (+) Transcript_39184:42-290(+)|eukprot:CAMPEP_0197590896 /NCGR_PEP_ID=MMETSP1326-20131121/12283_1 /TAXON_ID=1155430 /ORGANISM="Genus nov. species nov., Strain RCC2288" /LENGTH=82 /DNA_ID=CAMNT_0043156199 /DNA_START=11 /DNA_END=259 /DNA_ORIENTATION=+
MAARRPELSMDAKWEAAIDLTLRRLVYGSLAGGAAGLMLFRGAGTRSASLAFGAGAALGSAYTDCSRQFESLGFPKLPPHHK